MKRIVALIFLLMMVLTITACGKDDDKKDSDTKDSKPTEQQNPTKGEDKPEDPTPTQAETTPEPVDGMEIMDTAREVADALKFDLNKMMPESFCALRGTNGYDVRYSIVFLFKEELKEADRERVLDTFNEYLKSISKDGKIYLDMSGTEWYAEHGREGESQREVVFVKMDGFGFNINVLYANDNAKYTDGKMYSTITVEFMKFDGE